MTSPLRLRRFALLLTLAGTACAAAPEPGTPPPAGGAGGEAVPGAGGAGGKVSTGRGGSGGASREGGAGGGSGAAGEGAGGGGGTPVEVDAASVTVDAAEPTDAAPGEAGVITPGDPGQGPVAMGRIVYSQDFEKDMVGMNPGPKGLPADRAVRIADPTGKRGQVLKVTFQKGDNFRTSGGTEPRTWVSNRPNGYEFAPGTKVSHAFGIMPTDTNMNYCFAQVISTGGPVWMLIGDGEGKLTIFCNACGDANTKHFVIEPNKWHDFRVETDFRSGGAVEIFHNGELVRKSILGNTRGSMGHWDGGIYNRKEGTGGPTRVVHISNLSVGVK